MGSQELWGREAKVFKLSFLPTGHSSQAPIKNIQKQPTILPYLSHGCCFFFCLLLNVLLKYNVSAQRVQLNEFSQREHIPEATVQIKEKSAQSLPQAVP